MKIRKALCLVFVSVILLNSLTACTWVKNDVERLKNKTEYEKSGIMFEIIDDKFEYNGAVYYLAQKSYKPYIYFFDNSYKAHQGEVVGHFDYTASLGDISKTCEVDFDDNILKVSNYYIVDYALKEGFSLPTFESLRLDNVYIDISQSRSRRRDAKNKSEIEEWYTPIMSYSDDETIYLTDIIDLKSPIEHEEEGYYHLYNVFCTLKDYETIYLGNNLTLNLRNDGFYIWPCDTLEEYRVKDEYQKLFEEAIINIETQKQ